MLVIPATWEVEIGRTTGGVGGVSRLHPNKIARGGDPIYAPGIGRNTKAGLRQKFNTLSKKKPQYWGWGGAR
jgi:hypothetical protein